MAHNYRSQTKTPLLKKQRGFSLIELISVIVLIGILTAFIAPRFSGKDVFADYATQDLIIAGARIAQQRAMYDHSSNACYRLNITATTISAQSFNGTGYNNIGPADWAAGIVVDSATTLTPEIIYFDGLGNSISSTSANCGGTRTPESVEIDLGGSSNLQVCIWETGYLQEQVQGDTCG